MTSAFAKPFFLIFCLACLMPNIALAQLRAIPSTTNTSEWLTINLTNSRSDSGSLKASSKVRWDNNNLYFQIDVQDSTRADGYSNINRDFSNIDHVVICIDSLGNAHKEDRVLPSKDDYVFIVTPQNAFGDPMITTYGYGGYEHLSLNLRQVRVTADIRNNGYQLSIALPWSILERQPMPHSFIGLSISVRDVSDGKWFYEISSTNSEPHYSPQQWENFQLLP